MKVLLNHPLLLEWVLVIVIIYLMIAQFPTSLSYYLLGILLISIIARIIHHAIKGTPK